MSAVRRHPCRACDGRGRHEIWAMSPSEPVRLFTCTVCHGTGRSDPKPPMAPVSVIVAARARFAPDGSPGASVYACGGRRGGWA